MQLAIVGDARVVLLKSSHAGLEETTLGAGERGSVFPLKWMLRREPCFPNSGSQATLGMGIGTQAPGMQLIPLSH